MSALITLTYHLISDVSRHMTSKWKLVTSVHGVSAKNMSF